nr:helicase [Acidimicrobiia bacterium]
LAVREWFDEMWGLAAPFDLAALYEARFLPHSPYLIYLRMLWEKYGAEVQALAAADQFGLHLASFQKDGVTMAKMILSRYGGVVIADGVGLGKTFIAGELIREAVEERRQRVLVVAPAALRDGPWRAFKANVAFNFEVVSFDELSMDRQLHPEHRAASSVLAHPVNEYAMVVVDEAHAYRNAATIRADALNRLLEGSPPKNLVLLTATPVNNSLWDLYNLLAYFVRNDATFAAAGIPSLREKFKHAAATDPEALDPDDLFDVLSPVVVRRTRSYVKHYYPDEELTVNGVNQRISFPTPEVLPVTYDLATVLPGFLDRFAAALDVPAGDGGDGVIDLRDGGAGTGVTAGIGAELELDLD